MLVLRDSYPGIADREVQHRHVSVQLFKIRTKADLPLGGKFQCVAQQIHHDLSDTVGIASIDIRSGVGYLPGQRQAFLISLRLQQSHDHTGGITETERDFLELQMPGLDLGKIKNLIDDCQ